MITLQINGEMCQLDVDGETPLLWVLRDELKLTGTKFGCGRALCGACTVHLDGDAARSCSVMAGDAVGKTIVTIEGVSGDVATAVKDAWIKSQVPQCGYCQPGFVMAAITLLTINKSRSKIDKSQSKDEVLSQITNICRCGTYDAIRVAVGLALETLERAGAHPERSAP
jgi:isoquinoline 1-oxidoreductase alpha subunit